MTTRHAAVDSDALDPEFAFGPSAVACGLQPSVAHVVQDQSVML
jgi:hypothetical protein